MARCAPPPASSVRAASLIVLWLAALAQTACNSDLVNLGTTGGLLGGQSGGSGASTGGVGGAIIDVWSASAEPLLTQQEGFGLANPTLTSNLGELYYSVQQRGGNPDPYQTKVERAVPTSAGFGNPTPVAFDDGKDRDVASPAISGDGLELWLGLNLTGRNTDIYRSVKRSDVWSTPELLSELSSEDYDDVPRPPGLNGTVMPLSSKRHRTGLLYQIYFSTRDTIAAAWGEPTKEQLGKVNSPAFQSADGFLSADGLSLYFSSTRGAAGDADLYLATRASISAEFDEPRALADLNTAAEERMPWVSPDGTSLYYASNKATALYRQYALYVATKLP